MSLLSSLLLLILVARLFGRLFARYNQPEMIGEIMAGVLLGPAILGLIALRVWKCGSPTFLRP
jgi:Kef-type K+ transport system membrane component KefB